MSLQRKMYTIHVPGRQLEKVTVKLEKYNIIIHTFNNATFNDKVQ